MDKRGEDRFSPGGAAQPLPGELHRSPGPQGRPEPTRSELPQQGSERGRAGGLEPPWETLAMGGGWFSSGELWLKRELTGDTVLLGFTHSTVPQAPGQREQGIKECGARASNTYEV